MSIEIREMNVFAIQYTSAVCIQITLVLVTYIGGKRYSKPLN